MPSLWHYLSRAPMKLRKMVFPERVERLHLGSGPEILPGWLNVDNVKYPGVDRVLDVRRGLPFRDVKLIFAEHFIEHFDLHEAMYLLRECRRVLRADGILRLSTPNLDWIWASHYQLDSPPDRAVENCFQMNRAFRAWGHRFAYNEETLRCMLLDAGFDRVERVSYGASNHPDLANLERHQRTAEGGSLSEVIVVEASGSGGVTPPYLAEPRRSFLRDMAAR